MKTRLSSRFANSVAPRRPLPAADPESELSLYRGSTRAMLRRYLALSVETGRLPSVLGREYFRANLSSCRLYTFEDAVIFVHDVESAVLQLDEFSQRVLVGIILEDYSIRELAVVLRTSRPTIRDHYFRSLDELSEVLLRRGLLRPLSCQEAKKPSIGVKPLITK